MITCLYDDPYEGFCFARWLAHHSSFPKNDGCNLDFCHMRKTFLRKLRCPIQLSFDFYDENLENLVNINSI